MKIALRIDDVWYEAEGNAKTFRGIASQQRFKEQFGVPMAFLGAYEPVFASDDDDEVDWSRLKPEQIQALPDPNVAFTFLLWLELKRRRDDLPVKTWEEALDRLTDDPWIEWGEADNDPSLGTST